MGVLSRFKRTDPRVDSGATAVAGTPPHDTEKAPVRRHGNDEPVRLLRLRIFAMVMVVSTGGMIFGYDTGQISGFLEMPDFLRRFANDGEKFTNVRSGTIVSLLSIGTLIGALLAAPIADKFGRRVCIVVCNVIFCVGVIVQIATEFKWYQVAIGRWVSGLGVGGLSVLTPMYQSETAPRQIRGAMVSCYQLFITLGIFVANCINYATETDNTARSWRLPMAIGFIWSVLMAVGICFLRESPRWDYRHGKIDRARTTIAKSYGVSEDHWEVAREMREIKAKWDAENAGGGKHPVTELFTGPRMTYRIMLGVVLQALQQLTGANYFFYYGTTIFSSVGLSNSYVTAMILSGINHATTYASLYVVEKFGRRKTLITGSIGMFISFMIFASVGSFSLSESDPPSTPKSGAAMIVFAAIFIVFYAASWGPVVWCLIGEIYPTRYRARAMGIATSSNWIWNFLISFFTPFITDSISFRYGYVFASANALGAIVTYFFVCESQGRTLEETDTMYILHVKPWQSSKWEPPEDDKPLPSTDQLYLEPGARGIRKDQAPADKHIEGDGKVDPNTGAS